MKCNGCKKELDIFLFIKNNKVLKNCSFCREKFKQNSKIFRYNNPEKCKQSRKKYRASNLEKSRERDRIAKRKNRQEHPVECKKAREEYNLKNYNKIKAYDTNRMLNRPEYFIFSGARTRARNKQMEFDITEQDIKVLLIDANKCPLRECLFEKGNNHKPVDNSISLDRIDNNKGYTKNNIWIISHLANIVKNNTDLNLFKKIVYNLKNFTLAPHDIDDQTMEAIIKDRLLQAEQETDKSRITRIKNIEEQLFIGANKRLIARKKENKQHLEIDIDVDYIKSIWPLDNKCPILGEKFIYGKKVISDYSATIDRVDNNKGYVKGNVRIISNKANNVKSKCSVEELELICKNWERLIK